MTFAVALSLLPPARAERTIIDLAVGPPASLLPLAQNQPPSRPPNIVRVGPSRAIKLPSQAAEIVQSGDIVEIDADAYVGDVAVWRADNLTLRGASGRPKLLAAGQSAESKAIWVIKGRNAVVQNIEFAEAAVPAGNGAGIRAEGANLQVIGCYFHDNQEGILSSMYTLDSVIDIENSEFARDGGNGGQSHEIYISNIKQLIVRGSYFHAGRIGHLIKSRAQRNLIVANRITDEARGAASYEIEFPNGGFNVVTGNLIEQGADAQNSTILANALEGPTNAVQQLYVVNNTFVNDLGHGDFIRVRPPSAAHVINNIFVGGGNVLVGGGEITHNLLAAGLGGSPTVEQPLFRDGPLEEASTRTAQDAGLVDVRHYDYRLRPDSPAIAKGIDPGSVMGVRLLPDLAYVHPTATGPVTINGPIDVGAYQHEQ